MLELLKLIKVKFPFIWNFIERVNGLVVCFFLPKIVEWLNGFIVRQQDSQDLIDKIQRFLDLSYEKKVQMGLAARTKVEKEFDRQIVVNAYVKAVENLKR